MSVVTPFPDHTEGSSLRRMRLHTQGAATCFADIGTATGGLAVSATDQAAQALRLARTARSVGAALNDLASTLRTLRSDLATASSL